MKQITPRLFLVHACAFLLSYCTTTPQRSDGAITLLEVKDRTLIPEGIAVHPSNGRVYLSSLHHNKIVSVDDKGMVSDVIKNGENGFMWGLGMKFSADGKTLWACTANGKGSTALFSIDVSSGKVLKTYTHDSARFLNDLVILKDGRIFLTDTEAGAVFMLQNDRLELFLKEEQLKWADGIAASSEGNKLFVASGRYGLQSVDLSRRVISSATNGARTDYAIDGLVLHNKTLYAAIGWPQDSIHQHRILRYQLNDQFNFTAADTLAINKSWLNCPTTLALHDNKLFALTTTNLGIYNRHEQQLNKIMDSLVLPVVTVFQLAER